MIYKKLLEFQSQKVTVKKKGTNPHFNSSYATLNEVLDKVKAPLNKLGILILQTPEKDGLRTILLDTEDDTKVESFMPYVEISTAQKLGSNNTYLRRYALVTMLGLEDEDDDGNVASGKQRGIPVRAYTGTASSGTASKRELSVKQKNMLKIKIHKTGKPMPDEDWFDSLDYKTFNSALAKLKDLPEIVSSWPSNIDRGDDKTEIEGTREDYDPKTGQML